MPLYRDRVRKQIEALDPVRDHQEIVRLTVLHEFPWDYNRAMEIALYKTFASPSIAKVLFRSGEFEHHAQKRYDDTDILLSEILENGYSSERGTAAIEQLNWIHSHYPISNEDYLYVLSTFIFESERWINRYGYRKLTENEKLAGFIFWKELGKRMHIRDIPETLQELEHFNIDYERKNFVFHPFNARLAKATEDLMLGWFLPEVMFPVGRPFIHAIMDDHLLRAFNHPRVHPLIKAFVRMVLKLRAHINSMLPARDTPFLRTSMAEHRYYGAKGYSLHDLGPDKLKKASACPYHQIAQQLKRA